MAVYKRDMVDINLETGNIHRSFLKHSIGFKDQQADHFGLRAYRNGEPVNLTGVSIQGIFMPPQGSPIAITSGNIVNYNEAEVVLPQACYNYNGQFTLAIKLVDPSNSVTGTMRIVDGMVDNTHASGTVAPVAAIPSYQEVLSTYEQAIAAINKTVRFDAVQSLTDTQKATARGNISAPSVADLQAETTAREAADTAINNAIGTVPSGKTVQGQIDTLESGKVPKTTTVNGHALSANVTVTKADVGLGNVDNTSDVNKPVSTAQQAAIDAEAATRAAADADLKSALDNIAKTYPVISFDFASGGITATGIVNSNTNRIRSASSSSKTPVIQKGDCYYVSSEYLGVVHIYDSTTFNTSHHVAKVNDAKNGVIAIPDTYIGGYASISLSKIGHESDDISGDLATIASKVLYLRPALGNRQTDKTLSLADYPADAKETGDALMGLQSSDNYIKEIIEQGSNQINLKYGSGNINDGGGTSSDNLTRIRTAANNILTPAVAHGDYVYVDPAYKVKIALYNSMKYTTGQFVGFVSSSFQNGWIAIPDTFIGKYVGIVVQKVGYEESDISADIPAIQQYVRYIRPQNGRGYTDGERPVYAAFGASTTAGAVHHYTGEGITYTNNNFPDYLSSVLGLETFNLAVGSTGFLERADGDDNIMDQIYNNSSILSRAKLVTIMFGYGNDNWVGSPSKYFSIGHYTDYYPYDEEGYHPSGQAGLNTMISKGATLMGCLNWCIKWISEKYPYAQLVLIFGSPSANDDRGITMTAQTEGEGVAPYTLTFNEDPFKDNDDHYSAEYGIYLINEELKKLKKAMDIPIVNLFYEGNAFNWYSTYAKKPDNPDEYALFSTKGTVDEPVWNSHPNDTGYLYFARYVAGKVISLFKH